MSIQEIKNWLNTHPVVKGVLVVIEGVAVSSVSTFIHAYLSGTATFSKQGLITFGVTLLGAEYLAVKNYLTLPPNTVKLSDISVTKS